MDIIKTLAETEGLNYAKVETLLFKTICRLTKTDKAIFLLFDQSNLQYTAKKVLFKHKITNPSSPSYQISNQIFHDLKKTNLVERWSDKYHFFREMLPETIGVTIGPKGVNWLHLHLRFGGSTIASILVHIVETIEIGALRAYLPIAALILQRSYAFSNLKKTQLELNSVYGTTTDLICLVNSKLQIIWCNKLAQYYFGDRVIGKVIYEALHDGKPKSDDRMLAAVFKEGVNKEFERSILTQERGIKNYSCVANVAGEDPQGNPNMAVVFFRDITSQKKQEKHMHRLNEKLNRLQKTIIRQRSHNILGKVYSEMYHEVDQGISRVHGELNNLDQWIKEQKDSGNPLIEEFNAGLEKVRESFKFTETLDNSFRNLVFVRQIRRELEDYDLNRTLDELITLIAPIRNGEVIVEKEWNDLPTLQVMSVEINVALYEVLCNAVEAMLQNNQKEEPHTLKLKTWADDKCVNLRVEDNGGGLSFEQMMQVFDFYYSSKHHVTGIGVGMSVVNEYIVNRHNGDLTLDSSVENSGCFVLSLPIKK